MMRSLDGGLELPGSDVYAIAANRAGDPPGARHYIGFERLPESVRQ